jgi:hypothetical protein
METQRGRERAKKKSLFQLWAIMDPELGRKRDW